MTTITCQYSGLEFEAKSSRAKNHPALADLLSRAHRDGNYSQMVETLQAVRKAGGYTTIEEFVALVNARLQKREEKFRAAEAVSKQRRDEAEQQRREQNALLKERGYTWFKNHHYDFDHYEEEDGTFVWELYSADGRLVTVAQALDEIDRGVEVVAAEQQARLEAERQAQAEAEAEKEAERQREAAARAAVETVEVMPFDHTNFERIYSHMHNPRVSSSATTIYAGTVNGIPAGVVNVYSSYGNDYDDLCFYYCADPEAAGLERADRKRSAAELFLGI